MASAPYNSPLPTSPVERQRHLPALGLPASRERRKGWAIASILLHALIIAVLITPVVALHTGDVKEIAQGAGGPGPAGGGGGGRAGTGGALVERLQFIQVAPPQPEPQAPPAQPTPVVPALVPPKPVVPLPQTVKTETTPRIEAKVEAPTALAAAVPGVGGGTGHDGTAGSGPGSGGGVGSGVGTGRGSATGPGTGGGTQQNYPPNPTDLFIPPMPVPSKLHGFHLVAQFDVDATGKVLDFKFTPTPDGGYNKRLDEVFRNYRFRPGTRPDGTPIRMMGQITFDF